MRSLSVYIEFTRKEEIDQRLALLTTRNQELSRELGAWLRRRQDLEDILQSSTDKHEIAGAKQHVRVIEGKIQGVKQEAEAVSAEMEHLIIERRALP
jgi:hypothetical protein